MVGVWRDQSLYLINGRVVTAAIVTAIALQLTFVFSASHKALADPLVSLSKPRLVTPEDNSWNKSDKLVLNWDSVDTATKYEVRYGTNDSCAVDPNDSDPAHAGEFKDPTAFIIGTTDTHKEINNPLEGRLCWQVRAIQEATPGVDLKSDWSNIWSVQTDTVMPVVSIDSASTYPHFNGTVDDLSAKLTVVIDDIDRSDIPIKVDQDKNNFGTYDWSLELPNGISTGNHELQIKAVDAAGNTAITFREPFTVKMQVATSPGMLNIDAMQAATLPLVPTGPLVFVAPTPASVTLGPTEEADVSPLPHESVPSAELPRATLATDLSPKLNGYAPRIPVEATSQGWILFGVTWYWWVLGGGTAALGWSLLARWRLASRLG